MHFDVNGTSTFASTGGRPHEPGKPYVIFLHGSGQNRLTWTQQSRKFAYRGYNVLALDFPGHGKSAGSSPQTIEASADWVVAAMDALGIASAHIVAHSQGVLTALELGSRYPDRCDKIALVAGALAIPVNDALVSWADTRRPRAPSAMPGWGLGEVGHFHSNTVPGASHIGGGQRLMDMNDAPSLHTDLNACNAYTNGPAAAQAINDPVLVVLADQDKMTPIKQGRKLAAALPNATAVEFKDTGHMVPPERPYELNATLFEFLEN